MELNEKDYDGSFIATLKGFAVMLLIFGIFLSLTIFFAAALAKVDGTTQTFLVVSGIVLLVGSFAFFSLMTAHAVMCDNILIMRKLAEINSGEITEAKPKTEPVVETQAN